MTNEELMIADAEYWLGIIGGGELICVAKEGGIARIAALCTFYGKNVNADSEYEATGIEGVSSFEHNSWYSLLIAEVESNPEDVANWPFPVVHGSIPE